MAAAVEVGPLLPFTGENTNGAGPGKAVILSCGGIDSWRDFLHRPAKMNRRFVDLTSDQVTALLEADTIPWFGRTHGIGWPELLQSQRITVISEAGSGKTYECREEKRRLFGEGQAAFFFELSELAREPDALALLEPDETARFRAWATAGSDEFATFFLDAYDELKITRGNYRTALIKLKSLLNGNLNRIRLVVTSRPVPFDHLLLEQIFPLAQPPEEDRSFVDDVMGIDHVTHIAVSTDKAPPASRTVCLVPLDEEAIRTFVAERGLSDADAFIADLRLRHAFDFARRPQDLMELSQDWREHRRVRTHKDQVETNVSVKLRPRTDRPEPALLADAKAREGAAALALAVLLTKCFTIRHSPDMPGEVEEERALDPSRVLPDWSPDERQTLLERPLFSYASYGRVRFHHRSVLEFLAASKVASLLNSGMTLRSAKRLIYARTAQNIEVVRPSLRPVAAWLSLWNPEFFAETLRREPEVLITQGDPASLSPEQRSSILKAFVERNRTGTWRGHQFPSVQIQRFADATLGPVARDLWESGIENGEMREFLLEVAATTPLPEMSDPALSVFLDADAPDRERMDALRAILGIGDPRLPETVFTMAREPGRWTNRVLQFAVVELFPDHIRGGELRSVLTALQPSKDALSAITWNWPESIMAASFTSLQASALRQMLHELVVHGASWAKEGHHLHTPRPHLVPGLAAASVKDLQSGTPVAEVVDAAVAAVRFSQQPEHHGERQIESLKRVLGDLRGADRARVFWADDRILSTYRAREDPWLRFWDLADNGALRLDAEKDRDWVLAAVADRSLSQAERHVALHAALRSTCPDDVDLQAYYNVLREGVRDSTDLTTELERALEPRTMSAKERAWAEKAQRSRLERDTKTAKDRKSWEEFQTWVLEDPERAFSPSKSWNTCWNLWTGMRRGKDSVEVGWDRSFVEKHFNKNVADRLRLGLMAHWRTVRPPLSCERPKDERSTSLRSWSFALAGVYAEAEDPAWAKGLSPELAAQAARIATCKLNGLPEWLADLALEHPGVVETTLGPDLSSELDEGGQWSSYLQALRDAAPHLRGLFINRIIAWTDSNRDTGASQEAAQYTGLLPRALLVLLAHEDVAIDAYLVELAEQAIAGPMEHPWTLTGMQVLLRLDPKRGAAELDRLFAGKPAPDKALKERWIASLFGDRHGTSIPINLNDNRFTPNLLLRLVLLAYAHIRSDDDVHHEGTYSPDTRDDAQTGRNALLSAFLDREGEKAWQAKLQLADDPLLAHFRDRALALARESSATEADRERLTEGEVASLIGSFESPPKTREDMFELLSNRLDDLEDFLLGDASPRELWAKADKEYLLRRAIASELLRMSNGIYTVNQEAVTADEKETDVRLHSTGSDQEGVIEIKRAEGFTPRVLLATISEQLVKKYLAPESRRAGILVVTIAQKQSFEHPETGERLAPEDFLVVLKDEAARAEKQLGSEVRVGVRFLDLRPRLRQG